MKILNTDDLLEIALVEPSAQDEMEAVIEAVDKLASKLAEHFDIEHAEAHFGGKAFGGLCAAFYPSRPGQPCPGPIDEGDPSGDWERPKFTLQLPAGFHIMNAPVVSTKHITAKDGEVLRHAEGLPFSQQPDGYLGPVAGGQSHLLHIGDLEEWDPVTFSSEAMALFRRLVEAGYDYVRLDSDGGVIPGVPTFEW